MTKNKIGQSANPQWVPRVDSCKRVLVIGATGGIGQALVAMLSRSDDVIIGAHGRGQMPEDIRRHPSVQPFVRDLTSAEGCQSLIEEFTEHAGGLDGLVLLIGGMEPPSSIVDISPQAWSNDLNLNLSLPFFLAQAGLKKMAQQGSGGRIIFNGTESALHGGGEKSLAYGVAKAGLECVVKGLARTGAPNNILVNGVRLGFIDSGFHQRWQGKQPEDLKERAELVPLGRGGTPDEAAALIAFLLSDWSSYITGEMISLAGGDWL